jgi:hypothetical protein
MNILQYFRASAWIGAAKREAKLHYNREDMIDDGLEFFAAAYERGETAADAVKRYADALHLQRSDWS